MLTLIEDLLDNVERFRTEHPVLFVVTAPVAALLGIVLGVELVQSLMVLK